MSTPAHPNPPVVHKHGQHGWHSHPIGEYATHQQPIDDEIVKYQPHTDSLPSDGDALPLPPVAPAEPETTVYVVDGRDALAYVLLRPAEGGAVLVEANAQGLTKQDAAGYLRRIAKHWDPLRGSADDLSIELEVQRMKNVAVDLAVGGHWSQLEGVIGNHEHPYWSPTLDAVAKLTAQPAATAADRPDGYGSTFGHEHTWAQPRPGVFVCLQCPRPTPPSDGHGECAPWPCPKALEEKPALAHYNEYWPVGTAVQFRPNGVGDWTDSHTITPVWLGLDLQPYVSVDAYPPQSGAAVKIGDLRKIHNDGDGDDVLLAPLGFADGQLVCPIVGCGRPAEHEGDCAARSDQ